jgi:hypothetical protein
MPCNNSRRRPDVAETEKESNGNVRERHFEILCGIILAFLAAVLAISDLAAGRFDGDQRYAESQQASAYSWYESKSVKQTLVQGQHDLLKILVESGSISSESAPALDEMLARLQSEVERYGREKNEILKGSSVVGEDNWAQDVDGKLGKIVGAQEWEAQVNALDSAGNFFDITALFLQISLVLGAISLIFHQQGPKRLFFLGMNALGATGTIISIYAIWNAFRAS